MNLLDNWGLVLSIATVCTTVTALYFRQRASKVVPKIGNTVPSERPPYFTPFTVADDHLLKELWEASCTAIRLSSESLSVASEDKKVLSELSKVSFADKGKHWGTLGFQGLSPLTDLRGGGCFSLRQYMEFCKAFPQLHSDIVLYNHKEMESGKSSWFLEACVSIQLTLHLSKFREAVLPGLTKEVLQTEMLYTDIEPVVSTPQPTTKRLLSVVKAKTGSNEGLATLFPEVTYNMVSSLLNYYKDRNHAPIAPIIRLHGAYFRAFFMLWQEHRPFIMEYERFMKEKFCTITGTQLIEDILLEK